jgi:hypothetical protein
MLQLAVNWWPEASLDMAIHLLQHGQVENARQVLQSGLHVLDTVTSYEFTDMVYQHTRGVKWQGEEQWFDQMHFFSGEFGSAPPGGNKQYHHAETLYSKLPNHPRVLIDRLARWPPPPCVALGMHSALLATGINNTAGMFRSIVNRIRKLSVPGLSRFWRQDLSSRSHVLVSMADVLLATGAAVAMNSQAFYSYLFKSDLVHARYEALRALEMNPWLPGIYFASKHALLP